MSRPGFLSNGKTKASLQATGNLPDFKDILINLVSTGSRTSHRLTKVEGIGSVRWTKDESVPSMSGL